jgi:regulator of replication initiation timing
MTINIVRVCDANNYIANDYYSERLNNTEYTRSSASKFRNKASQQTVQRERLTKQYESRKNICDVCFTAKSNSDTCLCD